MDSYSEEVRGNLSKPLLNQTRLTYKMIKSLVKQGSEIREYPVIIKASLALVEQWYKFPVDDSPDFNGNAGATMANVLNRFNKAFRDASSTTAHLVSGSHQSRLVFNQLLYTLHDENMSLCESILLHQKRNNKKPNTNGAFKSKTNENVLSKAENLVWEALFGFQVLGDWTQFLDGFGKLVNITDTQADKLRYLLDFTGTGIVSKFQLNQLLRAYGSIENIVTSITSLMDNRNFFGFQSDAEVQRILSKQPAGAYMVSLQDNSFSLRLSYTKEGGRIEAQPLKLTSKKGFSCAAAPRGRSSLAQLMHDMNLQVHTAVSNDVVRQGFFYGELSRDDVKHYLSSCVIGSYIVHYEPGDFKNIHISYRATNDNVAEDSGINTYFLEVDGYLYHYPLTGKNYGTVQDFLRRRDITENDQHPPQRVCYPLNRCHFTCQELRSRVSSRAPTATNSSASSVRSAPMGSTMGNSQDSSLETCSDSAASVPVSRTPSKPMTMNIAKYRGQSLPVES